MAITLNYTNISTCETSGDWNTVGNASGLADSDYPSKEGSQCVEFDCSATSTASGIQSDAVTAFSIITNEVGIWFLNPVTNQDGNELLQTGDSALRLRVYSGSNWADYYQTQHKEANGHYRGGWMYLRASGDAGTEDGNSGTWGTTQANSVTSVAVIITTQNASTDKNAAEYGVDWAKYYDKIKVTGYKTGTTPYSPSDIYEEDIDKASGGGVWGIVEKEGTYFSFKCGLEFGDGTNAGAFLATSSYLYLDQSSPDQDFDVTVKNNFTLSLGDKITGTDGSFPRSGTPLVVNQSPMFQHSTSVKPSPDLVIESGGIFKNYLGTIQGFNLINLGSGGSSSIECIGCDFYDNVNVELRSSGIVLKDMRFHFPSSSKAPVGTIYSIQELTDIHIFQVTNSFTVRINATFEGWTVEDATKHLLILDSHTINMKNSIIDKTKVETIT